MTERSPRDTVATEVGARCRVCAGRESGVWLALLPVIAVVLGASVVGWLASGTPALLWALAARVAAAAPTWVGERRRQDRIGAMSEIPYWRVHVRVDEDPLSTLTFTRARDDGEEASEVSAEAVRAYADLLGLPEDWTVHVEVSPLAGPESGQDAVGPA